MKFDRERLMMMAAAAGALLLFIWMTQVLIFAAPAYLNWITGLAGLALVSAYAYQDRVRLKALLLSPQLRSGSNAFAFSAAVVAIVALLNVIATRNSFRLDLTANKFYSLSDQTVKTVKGLERDVKITAFFQDASPEKGQVQDLLKEYRHLSGKIKVEFVDPDRDPAKAKLYNITSYQTTVLESGSKRKDILSHEMFGYQFMGRQPQREFKGEEVLTSAILSVTQDRQMTVFFLEGHGERGIDDAAEDGIRDIKTQLERDNFAVKALNLLKEGKIPEDAELIVIVGPRSPIPEPERKLLKNWLKGNGRLLVTLDSRFTAGLKEILEDYGITPLSGVAVDPRSNYFFAGPLVPIPSYRSHDITKDLMKQGIGSVLPISRALEIKSGEGAIVSPLLETTSESWLERNLEQNQAPKRDADEKGGPLTLAAAASVASTVMEADRPTPKPKLVVFACTDFVVNKIRGLSEGNFNLFANSVSWLMESEQSLSIRPKERDRRPIFLSKVQASFIGYTSVLFAPLAVIALGLLRWWRRRSL